MSVALVDARELAMRYLKAQHANALARVVRFKEAFHERCTKMDVRLILVNTVLHMRFTDV